MKPAKHEPQGFILVASLWLVAALALLAAYIDNVAEDSIARAIEAHKKIDIELERRSTEATLIYLLASNRVNHRGFILDQTQRFAQLYPEELPNTGDGELWVTDQAYRGLANSAFSVQDEAGLVSVNKPGTANFTALLRHVGVDDNSANQLIARIHDYVDSNSALSLNGAEQLDYERDNAPPPGNWIMSTPLETQRVLGFDKFLSPDQWRQIRHLLTTRPQAGYNFNTMPPEVVEATLNLNEGAGEQLLEARKSTPIGGLSQIRTLTGQFPNNIEAEEFITMPGRAFRISLWHSGSRQRQLIGIRLTPYGEFQPWRKDYQYLQQKPDNGSKVLRDAETALL